MVDAVENTTSDGTGTDITSEIEVDKDEVKIYDIEQLVPSSTPITVPYLEIYRTNELEYIPYISPYNIGVQSSDTEESGDTTSEETTDEETTGEEGSETNTEQTNS